MTITIDSSFIDDRNNKNNSMSSMGDSGFVNLRQWSSDVGITLDDALALCRKRQINVTKIGNSRFANRTLLVQNFYAEVSDQDDSKSKRRQKAKDNYKKTKEAINFLKKLEENNQTINDVFVTPNTTPDIKQ
jgi:hypothetical protein